MLSRNKPSSLRDNNNLQSNRKSYVNFITSKLEFNKLNDEVNCSNSEIYNKNQSI